MRDNQSGCFDQLMQLEFPFNSGLRNLILDIVDIRPSREGPVACDEPLSVKTCFLYSAGLTGPGICLSSVTSNKLLKWLHGIWVVH